MVRRLTCSGVAAVLASVVMATASPASASAASFCDELGGQWDGQFCLKGVMSVEDANRAAEIGCTGIVLSNHGGRQLDGSRAPFDQLAEIVDAVGDRLDVMMDGGIQRGTHVLKALALGAKFVFVGRLWVWGLSIMGEHGVRHVMKSLLADLDILFNVSGIQSVDQIDKSWLESYPKSYTLVQERSTL